MFKLSAVHMYFSSTIRIQKCTGFKQPAFLQCLKDLQNVFFIDNPDPDPKLMLKPDPNPDKKKKIRLHNIANNIVEKGAVTHC
jgi:hypothetical protein